jgi:SpoVK/Ycf46/Vps4 family AAA+-type ATPase
MIIMQELRNSIRVAINALHPIIYLQTDDEVDALNFLRKEGYDFLLFSYDEVDGIKWLNEKNFESDRQLRLRIKNQVDTPITDFFEALSFIRDISQVHRTVLVILTAENFLSKEIPESKKYSRFLRNLVNEIKEGKLRLSIVLISPKVVLPDILEKEALIFESPYPNRKEIRAILEEFLKTYDLTLEEELKQKFISALQGLSKGEIDNLLHLAIANDGDLNEEDLNLIIDYKRHIVKKNALVEYIDLRNVSTEIGGLDNLKSWLERKREIFKNLDKAIEKGVDIPKGILLFGMPGCGKSLAAKYTAKLLDLPLLRLDMGKILGPYLGQSEENLQKAIKIAESIAPSVLWIDEIEKALAGVKGNNHSNDTIVRIFGTLLTWMQEKNKPVFVVATANDISGIPPEFLRKGRFDEIFFVDFPDKEEMKQIFEIHLRKRNKGQYLNQIDFKRILKKMKKGYSGADIEAIVAEAVERAFLAGRDSITTEDLLQIIEDEIVKPMEEVLKSQVEKLRKIFKNISAKPANKKN